MRDCNWLNLFVVFSVCFFFNFVVTVLLETQQTNIAFFRIKCATLLDVRGLFDLLLSSVSFSSVFFCSSFLSFRCVCVKILSMDFCSVCVLVLITIIFFFISFFLQIKRIKLQCIF